MSKSSEEKNNKYKQSTIDLNVYRTLDNDAQKAMIKEALEKMWGDTVKVEDGHINKIIKLTMSPIDDEIYLPKKVLAEKKPDKVILSFTKKTNPLFFFILFGILLLLGGFTATYSGFVLIKKQSINIDIDGDGIPDINLDLDGDDKADINIDYNKDNKPNLNIDYKGNRIAVFNLDKDGDGEPDFNLVNDASGNQKCEVNCDANGDGWPDYNIDLDGDGEPDIDIDVNGDGIPELNIDTNGDCKPDLNIDNVGDKKCHENCTIPDYDEDEIKQSGPSIIIGDGTGAIKTANLRIVYMDDGPINVEGLFPTDQTGVDNPSPVKRFTVTNDTKYRVAYRLSWQVVQNTYTTNHFQYQITSTNGGFTQGWTTAPWNNTVINEYVLIGPYTTQEYTITFRLLGINGPQNEDQNRVFNGYIRVGE